MAKRSGGPAASTKQKLIDALNEDLSLEFQAIARYIVYAAQVHGPYRPAITSLFRAEIADELLHAAALADKVAALGGTPHVAHKEVEPADDPRTMLEVVLRAEEHAVATYRRHLALVERHGDIALKVQIENMIGDETKHVEEVRKTLADWV